MKLLCLHSSPNTGGVSRGLAEYLYTHLKRNCKEASIVDLNALDFKACQACLRCKLFDIEGCVLNDELRDILFRYREADILILASPIYAADVNVKMKKFIERSHCFASTNRGPLLSTLLEPKDKRLVMILTQGKPSEYHKDIANKYEICFRNLGYKYFDFIRSCEVPSNSKFKVENYRKELMNCQILAQKICKRIENES